ncbi:MAG: hypothetical protein JWL64_643, partial [Frankiales bacterium]|nr:hypothetical protein [Frankiales bacterium]
MTVVDLTGAGGRFSDLGTAGALSLALGEGQDLLCRVVGQVGEGVAVFDLDDRLVYANPALGALHGCHCDDLLGQPVTNLLGAATAGVRERTLWAELGEDVVRVETQGRRLDGVALDIEVALSWLRDDSQVRVGRIACVRDIS